jgi:arylsulfatase A-like enzyme
VSRVPVSSIDYYPTIAEMAGVVPGDAKPLDGVSLVSLLRGKKSLKRTALYWHYPHYSNQGGFPGGAIRMGKFKLIERYEDGRVHLYDLSRDVSERNDLAADDPKRASTMRRELHRWYGQVDAKFLQPRVPECPAPWRPGHD